MSQTVTLPAPGVEFLSEKFARLQAQPKRKKHYLEMSGIAAVAWVAISVIIMAYSSLFSVLPIVLFYALWLPQIPLRGLFILRPSRDMLAILALPLLGCLSAFWSDYRQETLYHGLEFLSLAVCVTILSRVVSTKFFLEGIALGTALVLLATLINGTYGTDYFSGTYSLVGLFGSKNQVGFIAEIGILASIAILFAPFSLLEIFFFSFIPFVLSLVALYLSKSATAVVTLAASISILMMFYFFTRFSGKLRIGVSVISLICIGIVASLLLSMGAQEQIFALLGKDTTLTGRTYLWGEGYRIGWERPLLGHGYSAFWVPGQLQAERYWYEFGITGKSGFHFHELFIQAFVDLGLVGLCIVVWLILANVFKTCALVLREGMHMDSLFPLALSVMFLLRATVEVDFLGPFGIGAMLFYSIIPRLAAYQRKKTLFPDLSSTSMH